MLGATKLVASGQVDMHGNQVSELELQLEVEALRQARRLSANRVLLDVDLPELGLDIHQLPTAGVSKSNSDTSSSSSAVSYTHLTLPTNREV